MCPPIEPRKTWRAHFLELEHWHRIRGLYLAARAQDALSRPATRHHARAKIDNAARHLEYADRIKEIMESGRTR